MDLTEQEKEWIFEEAYDNVMNSVEVLEMIEKEIAELTALRKLAKRPLALHFK